MSKYELIINKLKRFIHKYYVNELLKGLILFFAIGLLYFIITVGLEYFLWLSTTGRLILFWIFIAVELALFGRFIIYPLLKLFKLSKGISYEEAADIIGKFFPEINDKLLNVLQLKKRVDKQQNTDLLLAGIDQKSEDLQPIPFSNSINFKNNFKYLKYAIIPILIIFAIWISGKSDLFTKSYSRVVNYKTVYEPPAPFQFIILNKSLKAKQNKSFTLNIKTQGNLIPDNAKILIDGEPYLLENKAVGLFSYQFDHLNKNINFQVEANGVKSRPYQIEVINVPSIDGFEMQLNYPKYLNKPAKTIKGTGNATIPEGTEVSWTLKTTHTNQINLNLPDTVLNFEKNKSDFSFQQRILNNTYYKLTTSNKALKDYEELSYQLKVIKDQYPEIKTDMKQDTVHKQTLYFHGQVSDDYGLKRLELVYYPTENPKQIHRKPLGVSKSNFDEFVYVFPDTIALQKGESYELYFQVFDNDGINGSKATKSELYSYRKLTDSEHRQEQLQDQNKSIEGMTKSLREMNESEETLDDLNQLQKEKSRLDYNDKKKFEQFYKRQKKENEVMKNYSKKMRENLDNFKDDQDDKYQEKLKEKLDNQEKRLEENEKLLEELQKYQDKLSEKELSEKLDKLSKQKKNQNISLEKLLELTKRYYVQQKAEEIAKDLHKLSKKQRELSNKDEENNSANQKKLSDEFESLQKQLDDLDKENKNLKKPLDFERKDILEDAIKQDQQEAENKLQDIENEDYNSDKQEDNDDNYGDENPDGGDQPSSDNPMDQQKQDAQQKQKSAADKMEEMGQGMQSMMQMANMEQMSEDIEMLRQILKNLITFSFQQEDLMDVFEDLDENSPTYRSHLKRQYVLKENFQHIDDSLYALTLRNPFISDQITSKLVDINFNIEKSLERIQKNRFGLAVNHQRMTMTYANDLANMLDSSLENMQMMQASSSGQGQGTPQQGQGGQSGQGFQLPDIIKAQEDLKDAMEDGGDQKGGEQEGDSQGDNSGDNQGEDGQQQGQDGESGKDGGQGKNGSKGNDGQFSDEMEDAELYEIYKQQQKLRFQLEDLIRNENLGNNAKRLSRQMEQVEQKLLRDGVTKNTGQMMNQIKENLIRLQNASYKQRQSNQRESHTNEKEFNRSSSKSYYEEAKKYFNTKEILNRQSLPLQPIYKDLIQDYFKKKND